MNLKEKLLSIQKSIDKFVKDSTIGEGKQAYKAVGSEQVLEMVRPLMNDLSLLLVPSVESANVLTGTTSSGTARYFTELYMVMTWIDVESGEEMPVKWYGQGVDLAGEKGVGKANTYAEKYFFMKFFHVPTPKDDPDSDTKTKSGEKTQKGTQAAKETADYCRKAVSQMVNELCGGDDEKVKQTLILFTKNDSRQYAGVDSVDKVTDAAVQVLYAKIKKTYEKKTGKAFELVKTDEE